MRRKLSIEISYDSDSESKTEIKNEEYKIINYLRELIDSDFHERFKLKIKKSIWKVHEN